MALQSKLDRWTCLSFLSISSYLFNYSISFRVRPIFFLVSLWRCSLWFLKSTFEHWLPSILFSIFPASHVQLLPHVLAPFSFGSPPDLLPYDSSLFSIFSPYYDFKIDFEVLALLNFLFNFYLSLVSSFSASGKYQFVLILVLSSSGSPSDLVPCDYRLFSYFSFYYDLQICIWISISLSFPLNFFVFLLFLCQLLTANNFLLSLLHAILLACFLAIFLSFSLSLYYDLNIPVRALVALNFSFSNYYGSLLALNR